MAYLIQVLAGVVLWKGQTLILGRHGTGYLVLLQTTISVAMIPVGLGLGPAVTRVISGGSGSGAARRTAILLRIAACAVLAVVFVAFRAPLSVVLLGGSAHANDLLLVLIALAASSVYAHDLAVLSAYRRVRPLSGLIAVEAVVATSATLAILAPFGQRGVATSLVVANVLGAALSRATSMVTLPRHTQDGSVSASARGLLRIGIPFALSMSVGTAAVLAVPYIALHALGTDGVALYQAATTVSVTYLGLVVSVMSQDYYPRVAAAPRQAVGAMIGAQAGGVVRLAVPVILLVFACAPIIVRVVYTSAFDASAQVMRWQLLSDALRYASWAVAFAIMARMNPWVSLGVELVYGVCYLGSSALFVHWFGLDGLGIASIPAYGLYLAVTVLAARRLAPQWTAQATHPFILANAIFVVLGVMLATRHATVATALAAIALVAWVGVERETLTALLRARLASLAQ